MEKFSTWTNRAGKDATNGDLTKRFTLDQLLTNIMVYWVGNSITSSQRFYKENLNFGDDQNTMDRWENMFRTSDPLSLIIFFSSGCPQRSQLGWPSSLMKSSALPSLGWPQDTQTVSRTTSYPRVDTLLPLKSTKSLYSTLGTSKAAKCPPSGSLLYDTMSGYLEVTQGLGELKISWGNIAKPAGTFVGSLQKKIETWKIVGFKSIFYLSMAFWSSPKLRFSL